MDETISLIEPTPPPPEQTSGWDGQRRRAFLILGGTLLITVLILLIPLDLVERLGNLGYLGVFVLTLLSSATIMLPSPALGAAILGGAVLNPWLVGVLAGIAAGLGETTGYLVGYSGSTLAGRSNLYPRIERWVRRQGYLAVFTLAAVPSPLIDLAGIAAGTMRMRYRTYLAACILGKTIRFILVAWLGRWMF